ncbi:uncharacterized protein LOC142643140 isoform X2 [Castanea sativa]|uniref:uncharacterized protein LOC142643140 isoform X2 n=1 Tax=Castanea sativa TaxID=21020 RepID=UPI003F64D949
MAATATFFFFFFLFQFTAISTFAQHSAETLSEIQALMAFKANLHDPLGVLDGWDSSTPSAPCDWRGIVCFNNRVRELHLPRLQLGGRLTDQLSNLRELRKLSLHSNHLNGSIPSSLSQCALLRVVYLHYNSLSGTLPPSIVSNLTNLQILSLSHNLLSGKLSNDMSFSLRFLDLSSNFFSGEIPTNFTVKSQLRLINFSYNSFSGQVPASLGELQKLEYLSLDSNQLYGTLPSAVTNCSSLIHLSAEDNALKGLIPATMGAIPKLQVLSLSHNELSGRVPASVGSLMKLAVLDLSKQNLSGELPNELFGLPSLQVVALEDNHLSGNFPEGFSSLVSLQYLNLSSNAFTGEIPATYGFLQSLLVLSASHNRISGIIPAELGNCSDLQVLELRSNRLEGQIPSAISQLSRLKGLDLGQNNFTGEIPDELSKCSSLTSLLLDSNNISGHIPDSLSKLSNLSMLNLSSNKLSGAIPSSLSRISGLKYLNLSSNDLEGEIPKTLSSQFNDPTVFAMNRKLCGKPLSRECPNVRRRKRKRLILFIGVAIAGAFLLTLCCCGYIYSLLRWRKKLREGAAGEKKRSPASAGSGGERGSQGSRGSGENGGPKLVMFNNKITVAEALEATRQFDEENVLSRGRYGLIFKATFQDGMVLAIRRLPDGSIDEGTFRKEAESLGKVKHRNLTVLRGYYAGPPDVRLLVYDYMPNGNLATLLQEASHQEGHVLNWPMRHLIALGIARGLAFLHSVSMVHGDIKPLNVLFDADFEAHLSEFGLDKLTVATPAEASTSSTPIGSLGYVSPEAALTGQATREADVYSFGIILLEILTGRKPVMFTQDEDIVKWVKRQLQRGQISELLEPGLLELDPESSEWEEFLLGVKVALLCTAPDPLDRPSMADIVFMLEGCRVGPEIPSSADPTTVPSPVGES